MKKSEIKKMVSEINDEVCELKYHTILENKDDLLAVMDEKLRRKEMKLDRMKDKSGISYVEVENLEKADEYIKIGFVAFIKESVEDHVQGMKQEVMYTKEYQCTMLFFKKFAVSYGAAKAIDHATKTIAEYLNIGFDNIQVEQNIMNRLPDFFDTLNMVDGKNIDHSEIKKEKVQGYAKDVQDFIPYDHDINSVTGLAVTPIEEIKLTIKKSGKIKFHTKKETNIFTGHIMYGWCLLTGEALV